MSRYIIGAIVGAMALFVFTMREPTYIYTAKAIVRTEIDHDTMTIYRDTTIYIDSTEYHVPIYQYSEEASLPFFVDKKEYQFPFLFEAEGYLPSGWTFSNLPMTPIKIEPARDPTKIYWQVGAVTFGISTIALSYIVLKGR